MKIITGRFPKKIWIPVLIGVVLFYFSFDFLGDLMYKQALGEHSEEVIAAMHGAKTSPKILARTGDIISEEYNLNTPYPDKDSVVLTINLGGEKADVKIKAYAVKQISGIWKICKSDTIFSE